MASAELKAEAKKLRAQGLLYREIGERFGVSTNTAVRWIDEEAAERNRLAARGWKARNKERIAEYDRELAFRRANPDAKPTQAPTCSCDSPWPETETVEHLGPLTTCLKCSREVP